MKFKFIFIFLMVCTSSQIYTQGMAYGVKGGTTIGFQRWNNFERDPLVKYNVSAYLETLPAQGSFGLLMQLGYHQKGSATYFRNRFDQFGNPLPNRKFEYLFENVSLVLGAKSGHALSEKFTGYYMFGIRGDYTVDFDLAYLEAYDDNVRRFNYGATIGGGIEFMLTELIGMTLEAQFHPDFSQQIYIPPGIYYQPDTNVPVTFSEQKVINTAFEITLGFRFLNKYEYEE